jgi:ubiquitin-like-conjugating enzyme ATG3
LSIFCQASRSDFATRGSRDKKERRPDETIIPHARFIMSGPNTSGSSGGTTLGRIFAAREWMSPALKKSQFLTKGVLTPEEFVAAGDELTFRCPTWTWERGSIQRSHLPADKQYLVTRNVPCACRVRELESQLVSSCGDDNDDDWMVSEMMKSVEHRSIEDEFDVLDEDGEVIKPQAREADSLNDNDVPDEYADIIELEDSTVLSDNAVLSPVLSNDCDDAFLKVRTYDLSITYDKYYQTPRLWIVGYDNTGQPLSAEDMMQDVMQDYAHKTVTMESHPHLSNALHASIHPCRHAQVMKRIVTNLTISMSQDEGSSSTPPKVEGYLFIFLKFVSSIIPTINYDFTIEVNAPTSK